MVFGPVEIDAVAPHLLLVGQHVPVAGHLVKRVGFAVSAAVGIQIVALLVPDIGVFKEKGVVGSHVVDHRVALQFVFVVAHFDPVDADQLLAVGVVVTAHRLQPAVAVDKHAAPAEFADVLLRVEKELVGVERGVLVDHLDDIRKYAGFVHLAVVFGPVAVNIGRILVDQDIAEEFDAHVRIADGAVTRNDGAVVLRGEVAHQKNHRIARSHGTHVVRLEVDEFLLGRLLRLRRLHPAAGENHTAGGQCDDRYGKKPAHGFTSPNVCSRTLRRGIRDRYRHTWRRSSSTTSP